MEWSKGHAVRWLLSHMSSIAAGGAGVDEKELLPVYIGDDVSDEDAFAAIEELKRGVTILVRLLWLALSSGLLTCHL